MNRTILVTGASGKQGGAAARYLIEKGWDVRALTRSPAKDELNGLRSLGARIVKGDLDDTDSLREALEGVYGVFSVQNSWEHGVAKEVEQGKRLIDEAENAGIGHFVYSSVGSAHRSTRIPHFESKWEIERHLRSSDLCSTVLRPVFFMENLLMPQTVASIGEGILPLGVDPSKPLQMIAVDDIGVFVAKAFEEPVEFETEAIDIAGDELTGPQMAAILGTMLGHVVEYRQTPIEQIRSFSEDYALMIEWFNRVGYDANIPYLKKMHPGLKSFETWAMEHASRLVPEHAHA